MTLISRRWNPSVGISSGLAVVLALSACGLIPEGAPVRAAPLVEHLAAGEPVFGVFSGPQTREQGMAIVQDQLADFVLYSMESGPFDVPTMVSYMEGMREAEGPDVLVPLPVVLRVPPIRTDAVLIRSYVESGMETGLAGIVYPHVMDFDEADLSVVFMTDLWPANPQGTALDIIIIEDKVGIANAREIMATPGLSVAFAGPGDLRRAYEGDMEAVEAAIQTVLAACLEFDVVCGVTAGVDDIAARLEQGFRMIIVTQTDALAVGLEAAGRLN